MISKYRKFILLAVFVISLLCLTACNDKKQEETVGLQVKTIAENQKYIRTEPIHTILELGFTEDEKQDNIQWVPAQKNNIESYTIRDGKMTVTVSAVISNVKHTKEITIPLDESPIGVGAFFDQNPGDSYMLNGIVAGFSTTGEENEVILADKDTGKYVSVTKMGEGTLLYGGYSLPGVEIGDEIIIPVTLVKEKQANTNANSAKTYAEYTGGTEYQTAVVSKKNQIKQSTDIVMIETQADLEAFLKAGSRESNHYKTVKLKGSMNFAMDSAYENYNFWFSELKAEKVKDIRIGNVTPCFSAPSLFYTTGGDFSEMVFGEPHKAAIDYANPLSAEVEIKAVFLGGNGKFAQFLMLDQSWVTKK